MEKNEIQNIILHSMGDTVLMFWDVSGGFSMVCNRSGLALDDSKISGLDCFAEIIFAEDLGVFGTFLNKMRGGLKGSADYAPITDDRVEAAVRMKKRDGKYYYHNIVCYLMKDGDGAVIHMTVVVLELTSEEIYRISLAKSITNDRNPKMFNKVSYEIVHRNPDKKYALIQFDVAKFKAINEMYGEAFGDELLEFFVEALKIVCDKEQLFVRLSADVFMILTSYETKQDILDFIDKINANLQGYKGIAYRLVFGVCCIDDIDEKFRKYGDGAALARQSIKENVLENVKFYEDGMKNPLMSGKYLEDHMVQALENNEFVMYLQPKYCIETDRVIGAEALVRWVNKERGIIPPMEFIPLFEKNGFVTRMDTYIWEEACKLIRKWLDEGRRCVPISVNMSRIHLKENTYLSTLNGLIDKYGIPKQYLEIEITESAEENDVNQGIAKLKDEGYVLLMDDFGSGYSSLNTLKDTKFDTIKIDRMFLQDFIESPRGQRIVEYVIGMAQSIGLDVVAEGVETKQQAEFLLECGCNIAQGFYYAKPMPVEEFDKLL